MRVAHGHHAHAGHRGNNAQLAQRQIKHRPTVDLVADEANGVEGDVGPVEHRRAHVHRDTAIGVHAQFDLAFFNFHADCGFVGQTLVLDIAHKTTGAVSAVLHFAAIGVVDHVFKIQPRCWRRPHGQDLVGPHAKVAVGQKPVLCRTEAQAAARLVEHDKVVAGPLHLGKTNVHVRDYRPGMRRQPPDNGAWHAHPNSYTLNVNPRPCVQPPPCC